MESEICVIYVKILLYIAFNPKFPEKNRQTTKFSVYYMIPVKHTTSHSYLHSILRRFSLKNPSLLLIPEKRGKIP